MTWALGPISHRRICFNRDELKTRGRATPPQLHKASNGLPYLAPLDSDAGGSWIVANAAGLTIALLNRWHEEASLIGGQKSRGQLVVDLAGCRSQEELSSLLATQDFHLFRPFTLVVIDANSTRRYDWAGESLVESEAQRPITSSSYCFHEVRSARREAFAQLPDQDPDTLWNYQNGTNPPSAFTVRMNRPDAQTWSRSRIDISDTQIDWLYLEEHLDLNGQPIEHKFSLLLES